jgi:ABC transport system ATP-binding/permease protein
LTRLLMDGPNVLLLDEPTNDLDIETLTSLEDLLDGFAGTILVVSHDRYFLERVCDRFVGVMGDGSLRDLPRGVEQYLELRRQAMQPVTSLLPSKSSSAAQQRIARKEMARLERLIARKEEEIASLHSQLVDASTDYERLSALTLTLEQCEQDRAAFEEEWLKAAAEAE